MKIAFTNDNRTILAKSISVLTRSEWTHCEAVFSDGTWISSHPSRKGVYSWVNDDESQWKVIEVDCKWEESAKFYAECIVGDKYDYLGAARTVVPVLPNSPDRWFCSELCACILTVGGVKLKSNPARYSPGLLLKELL